MKKKFIPVLAAVLLVSACGNGESAKTSDSSSATTTTPKDIVSVSISTTTAESTTATQETTTTPEQTTETTTEPVEKTLLWQGPNGEKFYMEDAVETSEYFARFDYTIARASTGFFRSALESPELFDAENYEYFGENAEISADSYKSVKAGDIFGSVEIESVLLDIATYEMDGKTYGYPMQSTVTLADDVLLSGLFIFQHEDDYAVSKGDILFIPDSSFEGMPMTQLGEGMTGILNFNAGGVYTDAPLIRLGNVFDGTASCDGLNDIIGSADKQIEVRATVTVSGLEIAWSDQFGLTMSKGTITDIELN